MRKKLDEDDKKYFVVKPRRTVSESRYGLNKLISDRERAKIQDHPQRNPKNGKPMRHMRVNS